MLQESSAFRLAVTCHLAILYSALGCNRVPVQSGNSRQLAIQAFEGAETAFAAGNFAEASKLFSTAIEHGLSSDSYGAATVKRTVCWGAEGKHQEALNELTRLEANAPNLDQVYAARAYVLAKQGKAAESRAALAKARQYNRTVQEFKD
ncbi:tetratricopeptide repeat protein [Lacipirellula parvula]|uniref:Tetratricopeptide repeat protein n=1 Tax=Lacipirellula parvula TaxID=2650471 RepID=A0A5K7XD03_9BACT|nr:tetratricopeptide repeat protein [Lacipirellula parvula]BBO30979.1 hypothetical protein PLANPX_0591 [Lacipirellula parvula]